MKKCKHVWAKIGINRLTEPHEKVRICTRCGHSDKYLGLKITDHEAILSIRNANKR